MKNQFPWYDSEWLTFYIAAKKLIKEHYPAKLNTFIEAFEPLQTRKDFEVVRLADFLSEDVLEKSKELIRNLENEKKETHEIFNFGRLVVHNHEFFNQLHESITDSVSKLVKEEVEPTYNFLSLYRNLGVCDVHMDAPTAKYTVDICIEQSIDWKIYISQRKDWAEDFEKYGENWQEQILNDPANHFTAYSLKPGGGIIFSGSSQWHYRKRIYQPNQNNFCNLIFFHFKPKGMNEIINPQNWAKLFDIPEIDSLTI